MPETYFAPVSVLNLDKTFSCGQCFRWDRQDDGAFYGAAYGRTLRLWNADGRVFCNAPEPDLPFWRRYFDLDTNYAALESSFGGFPWLRGCMAYGRGIRILRQEPWEVLCSFILSQCNNIPRIKAIIRTLCAQYGETLPDGLHAFPGAARLAPLSETALAPLHAGYRAAYILEAAKQIGSGALDLETLKSLSDEDARAQVKALPGVGCKVANCFLLYGLHKLESFPVDVWMRRALNAHFPPDFDPAALGPGAGLAQQYIFYYAREHGRAARRENCDCEKADQSA